jgi:hypothetical protein
MIQDFDAISEDETILLLARLAHEMTVAARGTYQIGTENILDPVALRAYNEVQHRITGALISHLLGKGGMPLKTVLEMVEDFGKVRHQTENTRWAIRQACSFMGDGKGRTNPYDQ